LRMIGVRIPTNTNVSAPRSRYLLKEISLIRRT